MKNKNNTIYDNLGIDEHDLAKLAEIFADMDTTQNKAKKIDSLKMPNIHLLLSVLCSFTCDQTILDDVDKSIKDKFINVESLLGLSISDLRKKIYEIFIILNGMQSSMDLINKGGKLTIVLILLSMLAATGLVPPSLKAEFLSNIIASKEFVINDILVSTNSVINLFSSELVNKFEKETAVSIVIPPEKKPENLH